MNFQIHVVFAAVRNEFGKKSMYRAPRLSKTVQIFARAISNNFCIKVLLGFRFHGCITAVKMLEYLKFFD